MPAKTIELKHDIRKTATKEVTFTYLDLDNVKPINDKFGHKEEDIYIRNFAQLFRTFFRAHDFIYRINGATGDEFGILIESNQVEFISKKVSRI